MNLWRKIKALFAPSLDIRARCNYWYNWHPADHPDWQIVSDLGGSPTALLDEPDNPPSLKAYGPALQETIINQTDDTPRHLPVVANIEWPWPESETGPAFAEFLKKATETVGDVLDAWTKNCRPRSGGFGAYGLHKADRWNNPAVRNRNAVVAAGCRKYLTRVDIDGYFFRSSFEPFEVLGSTGSPAAFQLFCIERDAKHAREVWNLPPVVWISHQIVNGGAGDYVTLSEFTKLVEGCVKLVQKGVLGGIVHFAGWGHGPIELDDVDRAYIAAYASATKAIRKG